MQSAPPVVYPVGRSAFQAGVLVALGLAIAATGSLFLITLNFSASPARGAAVTAMGVLAGLCWVACACLSWSRSPAGALHWAPVRGAGEGDAGDWSWTDSSQNHHFPLSSVERVLDLQNRVLLRFRLTGAGQRWVWAERSVLPARWADFRRALMSSHI